MNDGQEFEEQPNDIKAEADTLGAMMLAENVIPDVYTVLGDQLDEHDTAFYRPAHWMIYRAIVDIWDVGTAPDATLVATRLKERGQLERCGGHPYLFRLIEQVPTVTNAGTYATAVHEKYRDRTVVNLRVALEHASPDRVHELIEKWAATDRITQGPGAAPDWADRLAAGGSFVLDAPPAPPVLWGEGDQIGWTEGEALLIAGPPGVGKTTLAHQLVAGRLGILKDVLGMPVQPGERRVLYLAMDRPPQIARAMRRLFGEEHRHVLAERLIVWKGPPPADFARNTSLLAEMCRHAAADTVVVDSLKDAVLKLSDDESGSGYNRARQAALVEGVQVVELHHQRKAGGDNKKPSKLDDVYGSTWITAGAGSVIGLWGEAGDPVVELNHLKQPMEPLGPWRITHDHATGHSEIFHQVDLLRLAQTWKPSGGGSGLTAKAAACALFSTEKPTASEVEKARRKLEKYVRDGLMVHLPGSGGGADGGTATKYFRAAEERR